MTRWRADRLSETAFRRPLVRPLPAEVIRQVDTEDELGDLLAAGVPLTGARVQGLDLTAFRERLLARRDVADLVVLGGRLDHELEDHLREHGAIVFPAAPHAPIDPYRARLYHPEELYVGLEQGYGSTPDARAYEWLQDATIRHDAYVTTLRALHDDAMSDALVTAVEGRRRIGVMGGHALSRGTEGYAEAARLGHRLATAGALVLTGGGPGAMEAANLGAWCRDEATLKDALAQLAGVPSFAESIDAWVSVALEVRRGGPAESSMVPTGRARRRPRPESDPSEIRSIGIPTWFYGHEPPNVFADLIAKFFSNALREDLLLQHSSDGVVVLPGAAGTVQEVFQMATRSYYEVDDQVAPIVLVGREHWSERLPVWPLLQAMGQGRVMGQAIHLVDTPDEATDLLLSAGPRGTNP